MSDQYDETNRFAIFKNSNVEERQPTHSGKITIGGDVLQAIKNGEREFRLAAWSTEGKSGKFLSGQISEFMKKKDDTDDGWDDEDDF